MTTIRDIIAEAVARGWTYEGVGGGGHHRLRHPSGAVLHPSMTASDHRAAANLAADIRRIERAAAPEPEPVEEEWWDEMCPERDCAFIAGHSGYHRDESGGRFWS